MVKPPKDLTNRSLLAAPLYHTSLQEADKEAALRYLGLGAPFDEKDLMMLSELNVDVCKVEVNVQSGTAAAMAYDIWPYMAYMCGLYAIETHI